MQAVKNKEGHEINFLAESLSFSDITKPVIFVTVLAGSTAGNDFELLRAKKIEVWLALLAR